MAVRHLDIGEIDQATAPNILAAAQRSVSKASRESLGGPAWDMAVLVGISVEGGERCPASERDPRTEINIFPNF
jgi:hypothetical protein